MAGWREELDCVLDHVEKTRKPPVTLADPGSMVRDETGPAPAEESTRLIWLKFPASLYGADLKVALESTFPKGVTPQPNPLVVVPVSIPTIDHYDPDVVRYYHPAYELGSVVGRQFIFVPRFTKEGELFKRLVFRRKMSFQDPQRGRMEMMLGRMDEESPFGFSCWKRGDKGEPGFVALAFPGRTPTFVPVYVRIESTMPVFLKIKAEEVENGVLVSSTSISPSEAPEPLQ